LGFAIKKSFPYQDFTTVFFDYFHHSSAGPPRGSTVLKILFAARDPEGAGVEGEVRVPHRVDDQRVHERKAAVRHHEGREEPGVH
jgi:hypothetical protein